MKRFFHKSAVCLLALLFIMASVACKSEKTVVKEPNKNKSETVPASSSENVTSSDTSSTQSTSSEISPGYVFDLDKYSDIGKPSISSSTLSDSSKEEEDLTAVDANDKPSVENPAVLSMPMTSHYDAEANVMRQTVRNSNYSLPDTVTGQIWYISNNGNDGKNGKTQKNAWKSITALNYYANEIKAGDAVLFERGGVYRGSFSAISGVYYGAYGTGDKPCIYGSKMNYAKATWSLKHKDKSGNNNHIWVLNAPFSSDVGLIVLNYGEEVAYKKFNNYDMEDQGDFWCDAKSNYRVYMICDRNPSEKYKSIEIGEKKNIISLSGGEDTIENVVIENLCIKYTGGHGIGATGPKIKNITIRGCELGYIGGSYLSGALRYGNAIEFYCGCENIIVENNWIYQIYDSGFTYQGGGEVTFKNILLDRNLIEYCGMGSYEYWLSSESNINYAENVTISNNIMRFAGYNFGGIQRPDKCSTHIRSDITCRNTHKNFLVTGNIFDQSSTNLLEIKGTAVETLPTMKGNTYAQNAEGLFGTFDSCNGITFDGDMTEFIHKYVDSTGVVYVY